MVNMPSSTCKGCGTVNDAASHPIGLKQPQPGSISICLTCGYLAAFADDLTIRDLTDEEMYMVAGNPRILKIQKARADVMKKYRK